MQKHIIRKSIFFLLIIKTISFSQMAGFVTIYNSEFSLGGKRFYPLGTNAYYLHKYACANDTNSIQELFKTMNSLGMNTVRTWAFCDGEKADDIFMLQSAPYTWNENSFQKLDYVIHTAGKYNIKVILTFVNNWDDLGGMEQYLKWYAPASFKTDMPNIIENKVFSKSDAAKYYNQHVTETITHDDFYKLDTIKTWYKAYVQHILNRKNIFSQIDYKSDQTIMAFELANEPESADKTGKVIYDWFVEMAAYFKSIDKNHLLTTGESGFDIKNKNYGNYPEWILNGDKGISFEKNSEINNIDYTTAHLYAEAWGISSGAEWIFDHNIISKSHNKPFLLGEYGAKNNRQTLFNSWLKAIKETSTGGTLLWHLAPEAFAENDGYELKISSDLQTCNIIKSLYNNISNAVTADVTGAAFSNVYPNPSSREVYIKFNLETKGIVRYSLYNILGERLITEEISFNKGSNTLLINTNHLASGVYFVKVNNGKVTEMKKLIILR
jgi:mannan endo-1,4-beta-mannosidase